MECRTYYSMNNNLYRAHAVSRQHRIFKEKPPTTNTNQVTIETSTLHLCRARPNVFIISPLHEYHYKDLPQTHTASPSLLVVIERFNQSINCHYLFHVQQVILNKQMQVFNVPKTCLVHLFLYLVIAAE